MTTFYLSGPMAGYPEHNFPAFQQAQEWLTELGWFVFSPHTIDHGNTTEWADFLRRDLAIMVEHCQGIVLLPGWPQSRGACLELSTALALDWPVYYFTGDHLVGMNRGQQTAPAIDARHIARQRDWSRATFGPSRRTLGVIDHIRKELAEIEAEPLDLGEWVDVIILAIDGAWRAGHEPQQIIDAIRDKQARNEARAWPDWRMRSADQAIEHIRTEGASA